MIERLHRFPPSCEPTKVRSITRRAALFSNQPLVVNGRATPKHSAMVKLLHRRQRDLKRRSTWHEKLFKEILNTLGIRFIFQKGFMCKGEAVRIVDFMLPEWKLFVEIDGPSHDSTAAKDIDRERQVLRSARTYKFVRFTNSELGSSSNVVMMVWQRITQARPNMGVFRRPSSAG